MNFIASIFLLAGLGSAICVAYFFGHALSTGIAFWYIASAVALCASTVLILIARRIAPKGAGGH